MKNSYIVAVILLVLLLSAATADTSSKHQLSQAMAKKTAAQQSLKDEQYLAAARHYEEAVALGLSAKYGYWKAIDSYIKAGAIEKALKPMKIMADAGATELNYYNMLAEAYKTAHQGQYQRILQQVENNVKSAAEKDAGQEASQGKIYTQDVKHFFAAFDQAADSDSMPEKLKIYENIYFNQASPGMVDYVSMKISGVEAFVNHVEQHRAFYADVRLAAEKINDLIPTAKQAMAKMQQYYPEAPSSDIYFVMGMHTSAGTASDNGILLGADFIAESRAHIGGLKAWTHPYITDAEDKVWVVVHEYVHVLQNTNHQTVLGNALVEGGADFLANLLYAPPKESSVYTTFGLANEQLVKDQFKAQFDSTDISLWTGNNSKELPENWVPDLGYFVGHQIAKAYYDQADDKSLAIRELLLLKDPHGILKQSGYLKSSTE